MKKRASIGFGIFIVLLVIIFFDRIINFIVNVEWYSEVGYLSVYFTKMLAVLKLMVPVFIVVYTGIWLYYRSLKKSIIRMERVVEISPGKKSLGRKIFILVDLVVSFFISFSFASSYWYMVLQFANATKFNQKDPIFNIDISFYIFKLPLIQSIYYALMGILIFLVVITFVIYFVLIMKDQVVHNVMRKDFSNLKDGFRSFAGRQLAVISALILALLSFGYVIKAWNLVYSPRGVAFGASYTDVHVSLLFYRFITVVSIIAAVVIFMSVLKSKVKPIIISVGCIVVLVVIEGITSGVVQQLFVKSNEKGLEKKYIQYNIDSTRKAYNVDNVKSENFSLDNKLTGNDIKNNSDIVNNIRVNSFEPAKEFYNQTQTIRYYYKFNDIDVDRYTINGKYTQVFIAPREISVDSIDSGTWQNKHLIYTHGYGVVMSKVNSVTSEGQPDFVINDIPTDNSTDIKLTNPRIYFGEQTNEYAIADTSVDEVDYPKGGENVTSQYKGKSGINMSFGNRLLFAIYERDINILFSSAINSSSKILINRTITDRLQRIAPFLTYDKDPYIVIDNGKLYWVVDAYTTSDAYPYSQPYNGINYIRNSVKAVIDAENGDSKFYIADKSDPIINSYAKIFPDLFKDMSTMSQGLKEHIRYPEDLFNIQCNVLGKYHVTDPGVFFNNEDSWDIAVNAKQVEGEKNVQEFPYIVTKLPGGSGTEMALTGYFNMRGKENMSALLDARMDGDNYGKLVLYKFPTQTNIASPYMFKQKFNQDTKISQDITLWGSQGSKVIFGDTIIVPINNSLLYIEPLYLRASGENSIPEMKRVIVAYGNQIISANSIDDALNQLFFNNNQNNNNNNQGTVTGNTNTNTNTTTPSGNSNIKQAKDLLDKAIEAQKNGDWAKYGEYIKQLQDLLNSASK